MMEGGLPVATADAGTAAAQTVDAGTGSIAGTALAAGAQIEVRDEEWLVRKVAPTRDGLMVEVIGVSPLVRGMEAVFFEALDDIAVLDPRSTRLVPDPSDNHRRGRLYLEAVIRKTFLPQTETGLALADGFLMEPQTYQLRPAELALSLRNPQPRLLIADVVGLGKTLEIGIILAELIRRGRGERILVVTPQHILEQFQRELWTRFGIPLVRLDSTGIQRVQREIPSGRNPFAYFRRVIVSVDTLKNRDLYRHHLDVTRWDAVVIDETHNVITRGSQRNELARLLAPKTDALILASATPHNGDRRSFAELIRLLDPAAIADPNRYEPQDLDHLFIRRTKTTPEVREGLRGKWPDRGPSRPIRVAATPEEEAVFAELAARWIPADPAASSVSTSKLFAYTLLKAFLSSPKALLDTVDERIKRLAERGDAGAVAERAALGQLRTLAAAVHEAGPAKLDALVAQLREIGVGPGSDVRAVVFSERVATLGWLAVEVPKQLGFVPGAHVEDPAELRKKPWLTFGHGDRSAPGHGSGSAVQVMHGEATTDQEQMAIVERFGLRDDPVRLLFTGDLASEGVNLHQQCHHLLHYDLPWSLIRIEQRNGRIDRFGQNQPPEFRALILTSAQPWREDRSLDDRLVGEKLLKREEEAHRIEGTVAGVSGLYQARDEDNRLTRDLIDGKDVETSLTDSRDADIDLGALILGQVGAAPTATDVPRAPVPRLFRSSAEYFDQALREVYDGRAEKVLDLTWGNDGTIGFVAPPDLVHRLRALPASYLREQRIIGTADKPGRVKVTFRQDLAQQRLDAARESTDSMWPSVSYLTDVHPVLEWLTDQVLVRIGRHEAPVLGVDGLSGPAFLVQGIYSNREGRPTVLEWMAVTGLPGHAEVVAMDDAFLATARVHPKMPAWSEPKDLAGLQTLVPEAIDAAERHLRERRAEYDGRIKETLAPYRRRVERYVEAVQLELPGLPDNLQKRRQNEADTTAGERFDLVDALETAGEPMLRLLAVLEGRAEGEA